ncbi:MAG: hypothetical protein ACK4RV_10170 [Caulobacter sp.]
MANVILAYGNLADLATLSGGSWQASLPLDNIKDRRLGRVARTTSAASGNSKFDADFGANRLFRVIALVGHNISVDGQYRIRLGADPTFASTVHDSGWADVWPIVYPFGQVPWGSPNWWSGRFTEDQIDAYPKVLVHILSAALNAQYMRVEIDDEGNEAAFVQVGRLFAADGWQPEYNASYEGASLGWIDRTYVQEALSGAEVFDARTMPRKVRVEFPVMPQDEAMAQAFEIQRAMGTSGEVLFVWDPDDTVHAVRRQIFGRLRTLSDIENPGPDRWRAPFEIKELL